MKNAGFIVPKLLPWRWAPRERILTAASGGMAGKSTEGVRGADDVSGSQLYHYFVDREALLRAVIAHQTARDRHG